MTDITQKEYNEAIERDNSPRAYSLVKFNFEKMDEKYHSYYEHFRLNPNETLVFVGEIPNMPDHCILWKTTRLSDESEEVKTYIGYHTCDFIELDEEEL